VQQQPTGSCRSDHLRRSRTSIWWASNKAFRERQIHLAVGALVCRCCEWSSSRSSRDMRSGGTRRGRWRRHKGLGGRGCQQSWWIHTTEGRRRRSTSEEREETAESRVRVATQGLQSMGGHRALTMGIQSLRKNSNAKHEGSEFVQQRNRRNKNCQIVQY
jgi:hypothetical protein